MVAGRLAPVLLLATGLAALAPLAAAAEPATMPVTLHLHRDGGLTATPSAAPDAAAWVFGLAGADEARFATGPFAEAWTFRAPAVLTLTVALQAGIASGIRAILDVAGQPVAAASAAGPMAPGAHELRLEFRDFHATVPAGQRLGLTLLAAPLLDPSIVGVGVGDDAPGTVDASLGGLVAPLGLGGVGEVVGDLGGTVDGLTGQLGLGLGGLLGGLQGTVGDLGVPSLDLQPHLPDPAAVGPLEGTLVGAVVYDAATHPARLSLLREMPAPPPGMTPAAIPTPPLGGPDPAPPLDDGGGPAPAVPIGGDSALGAAAAGGFDPFLALVGAGTAAIAALSRVVLRRDV